MNAEGDKHDVTADRPESLFMGSSRGLIWQFTALTFRLQIQFLLLASHVPTRDQNESLLFPKKIQGTKVFVYSVQLYQF